MQAEFGQGEAREKGGKKEGRGRREEGGGRICESVCHNYIEDVEDDLYGP